MAQPDEEPPATAAENISWLKKAETAKAAEDLLIGSGWLPEPLRTPGQTFAPASSPPRSQTQSSNSNRPATAANWPWTRKRHLEG